MVIIKRIGSWFFAFLLIWLVFSSPFVFKGKIPIPADTILGMYHPWRDKVWDGLTAGVPFKNFLITDPVRQQYVWKKLAIESFKKGQLPLWNPYTHSGMPLLANFQTGVFYPLNLLFFLFNLDFAWAVYILLQPFLASIFMFFYLKELKLSNFASFFGGIAFAFSGFMTAWFEWGNLGHTALWLPLMLLTIEKIFKSFSLKWSFIFLFSLCSSFFAGHLQTFFYLFLFSLLYLVWRIFQGEISFQKKLKLISLFIIHYSLFIIFTVIQWFPTLQLIKLSAREVDQRSLINQSGWFLPYKHLLQFIAPDFFGNPATMNYWGEWNYGELIGYVGIIPLIFALLSILIGIKEFIVNKKVKLSRCFTSRISDGVSMLSTRRESSDLDFQSGLYCYIVILLIALFLALPTLLAKLPFLLKIPFISTAQPTRLLFLIDFCLSVLAAFGFNIFLNNQKKAEKNLRFTVYCLLFTMLILWFFVFSKNLTVTQRNLVLPTGLLFLFMISTFLLSSFKNKKLLNFYLLLITFLTVFDLVRFSWKFNPFVKKDWIFPKTKTIEFLQQDDSLWRMMTLDRRIFPPNFPAVYHLQTIEGYDPLYLRDYGCLVGEIESGKSGEYGSFNRILRPQNFESEIIDELNVKYILSLEEISHPKLKKVFQEGETRVYENLKVKPRIEFAMGQLEKINYQENQIEIQLEAKGDDELILRDSYYPGWRAEIDGVETEISRTEYGLRKIFVPEGKHQIRFSFSAF